MRRSSHTFPSSRSDEAQESSQTLTDTPAEEEPIHHYPHPIPTSSLPAANLEGESSLSTTQALEQLAYQSQLLVDLLGAVNSLTAAILAQGRK
jgi:hypothetical protein